ncbi:c-type cytochrome [Alkalibacillus haloalkaliphilus]|uniref:c-type cytochrome n=1 Tax=Alkalibacillus haloalkaliphilus TaxID=94136 RepID=UPI002936BA47|nr:cytochrome c [Alkalibacillus haloalkaliphilus]MDV2582859.1 cytochrome c [Alkalibacillus haloalkaliphilus]
MKKKLFVGLFGLMMVVAACGGGDGADGNGNGGDDTTANETAAGEELYQQNCASCHGGDLAGGGGPPLTDASDQYNQDEIVSIILEGYGSMAAVAGVSEEEAEDIADYVLEQ